MTPPHWPDLQQRLRAERHSRTCSLTLRRRPGNASDASGCSAAWVSPRNDRPDASHGDAGCDRHALVVLVVVGLAALDGMQRASRTAPPRYRIRRQHLHCRPALAVCRCRGASRPAAARTIWLVIIVAMAMRVMTLAAPPLLSTDVYRYVWDGRVQLAGISPYRYVPVAPELEFLRDDAVYPGINRADYAHTIYPPAAQMIFALAATAMPGVFGMKLMMAAVRRAGDRCAGVAAADCGTRSVGVADLCMAAAAGLGVCRQRPCRCRGRGSAGVGIARFHAWSGVLDRHRPGCRDIDKIPSGRGAARLLATAGLAVAGRLRGDCWWCFICPMRPIGWQVLGFVPGYAAEEGFGNGRGIFLLDLLGSVTTLPGWASRAYIALALGRTRADRGVLRLRHETAGDPGARLTLQARQAVILGAARSGRRIAALSVVFRLARPAGVPGAAAQRALDARRRAAAGARRRRVSCSPWRGVRSRRDPRRIRSAPAPNTHRADATPSPTERSMTATALKDPRRYFEAVDRRESRQPRRRCAFIWR